MPLTADKLKNLLDAKVNEYNQSSFIKNDPISIPHKFTKKQDIEIAAFFAAILAWGNRTTIINSCNKLLQIMDNCPYQFITQHTDTDLKNCLGFVHRTFNSTDLLYCIQFLQHHYKNSLSLESAFVNNEFVDVKSALINFNKYFFSLEFAPARTQKHIATPLKNSACKRLNMLLRWMVRKDNKGVDFGLWSKIPQAHLICPLDVHVSNVAFRLGLLDNNKSNWLNAVLLTEQLKQLNENDPVIYDYALFSLGVEEKFN
jgi:uncharacterized protein (TIGR02757 family)